MATSSFSAISRRASGMSSRITQPTADSQSTRVGSGTFDRFGHQQRLNSRTSRKMNTRTRKLKRRLRNYAAEVRQNADHQTSHIRPIWWFLISIAAFSIGAVILGLVAFALGVVAWRKRRAFKLMMEGRSTLWQRMRGGPSPEQAYLSDISAKLDRLIELQESQPRQQTPPRRLTMSDRFRGFDLDLGMN